MRTGLVSSGAIITAQWMLSATLSATSASPVNPFDTIDKNILIDVKVGDSVGGAHERRLFERDAAREERFRQNLEGRMKETLRTHGFEHDSGALDFVAVGIWGHQVRGTEGTIENVYLLELTIRDHDYRDWAEAECERDLVISHRAIGVADERDLERVLTAEALRLLEIELPP
jgi:hypothetical protein